jgi:hypothetical protein
VGGKRIKNVKKGLCLIWYATIWILWKTRNDKFFKDVGFMVDEIVEEVKVLSWRWVLSRMLFPGLFVL